jgi:MFS family permease
MESKNKKNKIYFGWWTVMVTGIISGLGHGFYGYGISVFFKDIAHELGISRAVTSVAAGVGRLEGGVTSPVTGWPADRYGPKWVIFW